MKKSSQARRAPAGSGRKPGRAEPKGLRGRAAARKKIRLAKMRTKAGSRWRIYYDVDGPRVRLGILWFIVVIAAIFSDARAAALVLAVACGAAATHALRTWRAAGRDVSPPTALVATAVVVAAGLFGPQVLGIAVMLLAGAAFVIAVQGEGANPSVPVVMNKVGTWLQCTLPPSVAGGCVVLLADQDAVAAIALILIVSSYESGDYLIGSGSANAVEGPIAGGAAATAMTLAIASFGLLSTSPWGAVVLGILVAVLAPLGQVAGSAILPHARSFAPALRRIDSLLLAAPVWYFGIDRVLL